jgi:hypothetical protein
MNKLVFIALNLLRALSPIWKPEATFHLSIENKPDFTYGVPVIADDARLVRVRDPHALADWFVIAPNAFFPLKSESASRILHYNRLSRTECQFVMGGCFRANMFGIDRFLGTVHDIVVDAVFDEGSAILDSK